MKKPKPGDWIFLSYGTRWQNGPHQVISYTEFVTKFNALDKRGWGYKENKRTDVFYVTESGRPMYEALHNVTLATEYMNGLIIKRELGIIDEV